MANKVVAFFVEGPTEIEFYKAVIQHVRAVMQTPFDCTFEWVDMRGIGKYKNDALRKFKHLQNKHPGEDISAILCIDTDAFDLSKKPPINKNDVKKSLETSGAQKVCYIEARDSIEDWFLSDLEGVVSYLGLLKGTKRPSGNGQAALKALFIRAHKVYLKGSKTENFIKKLNIAKIISLNCKAIRPLCQILGLDCKKVCGKDHSSKRSK
ncbi:DUF4276 family protein [Anaeromassilibacillus senegalensis]|uniref:DUF4276 family protein n=1 Tax=Anaeromassilibacillus senegalensis TaxID=1673717 RepID=A0ABS9CNY2_9FIRM|nr:DUF4276 family protein [Anaeromassilibacillus senegalensis]MCF2652851.1 hypothetical protein [Anaeromassilibacillus senegalensis]